MPTGPVSKKNLVEDLKRVQKKTKQKVSRNFYRAHGAYTEPAWQKYFSGFTDFFEAAFGKPVKPSKAKSKPAAPEVSEISGDTWSLTLPQTRIHTLDQLIEYFEVDLSIWEVERFRCNKWEMPFTVGEGNERHADVEPVYQVRADFKKKKSVILVKKEIEDLITFAKEQIIATPSPVYREAVRSGNMLEVNIPDVHFGKLAWGKETGFEPWDLQITETVYDRAIDGLIFRTAGFKFDEVVFIVGNDLLQTDDKENRTTAGTIVTTDGRYEKTFRTARRAVIRAIEKLRQVAPVKVIVVPGNHDELSTWHLGESLEIYFSKYDDVTVENEPTPRKFYEFGKVMLMFCHGHKGKRNDYPLQMATERPEMFGRTKWRETHCGHTHMTKLDEQHGVRVRVLPALCPPDDWHSENGYTGNLRSAEAYIWNREEGLLNIAFYNDEAQPLVKTKRSIVTTL